MTNPKFSLFHVTDTIARQLKCHPILTATKKHHISYIEEGNQYYGGAVLNLDDSIYSAQFTYISSDKIINPEYNTPNLFISHTVIDPKFLKRLITSSFKKGYIIRYEGLAIIPDFIQLFINRLSKSWKFYIPNHLQIPQLTYDQVEIVVLNNSTKEIITFALAPSHVTNTRQVVLANSTHHEDSQRSNTAVPVKPSLFTKIWSKVCLLFLKE